MNDVMCRTARVVGIAAMLCALSVAASAQEGTKTPVPHDQTISANPFGLMVECDRADATDVAAGFELGYSWLFGSRRNVGVSLGAGIDRLFFGDDFDIQLLRPNIRLVNVGIAF